MSLAVVLCKKVLEWLDGSAVERFVLSLARLSLVLEELDGSAVAREVRVVTNSRLQKCVLLVVFFVL